ncbi:MAG: XdhC family protein [Clostridiales bacterium]|nr:XdhC family protein [Clostridiales bacterium]
MENIFRKIKETIDSGQDVMLNMITASSGSTPRGAGAKMLVFADGSIEGTIGGGRAEYLCKLRSLEALKDKLSFTAAYDMSQYDVEGVGMICGGNVKVCFKYFSKEDAPLVNHVLELIENYEEAWLITRVGENSVDMGTYSRNEGVSFIDGVSAEEAEGWTGNMYSFESGGAMYFVELLTRKGTVYIFGAGHVSKELAPLLSHLDFRVVIYEERRELAEAFPEGNTVIIGDFNDIDKNIEMKPEDYAVIMTSGHSGDFDVLCQVLRKDLTYVGVIGSRTKIAITRERLIEAGISKAKIDTLHTPIGLAIKAVTPAEIAVSVAAELILTRAESEKGEKQK